MAGTKRIFDEDAYLTQYEGHIVSCVEKDGRYETVLDATIFFPEQGGQSSDRGLLGGQKLLDVQHREGVIYHITEEKPDSGLCELDWKHRFSNMQQHTGEHIFSGITRKLYGYENVGFHLSDHVVTLDTSGPLTQEQITDLEDRANKAIAENHAVKTFYPDPTELDKFDFRSKDGIEGDVRLVEIEGVDLCACCAPHVKQTGEIGILKIVDFQSYKGGTRVSILCGSRALKLFRSDEELVRALMNDFSCKREEIAGFIEKLKREKQELFASLKEARTEELKRLVAEISVDITSPIIFTAPTDSLVARNAVNDLVQRYSGVCGIFSGSDGHYNFIIGSRDADCNDVMRLLRDGGAKGGGSAKMVQGTADMTEAEIRMIWENVCRYIFATEVKK